jgi:nucleoside-diphosphate-sugar epimerase
MGAQIVMLTGNLGYIGNRLTPLLKESGREVVGYDVGYYEDCYLRPPLAKPDRQILKDVRDAEAEDFAGIEAVIHLAALSNDPLGDFNPALTDEINFQASARIAELSRKAGVKRFLYASSQSVYGVSDTSRETDEEGEKNPLTAYAVSKWKTEAALEGMATDDFCIVRLRPATAYGASPNLRTDIVFNAFVAYAFTTGVIEIKSDGTPWRPLSHVRDIAAAFLACLDAPSEIVNRQAFNVGTANNNYTVRQLAETAAKFVPGAKSIFTGEHTDPRSYRVSSRKILTQLKDYYRPAWNIDRGGEELLRFYRETAFTADIFNSHRCTRLKCLKKNIQDGLVDENLRRTRTTAQIGA